jgi:hypothetical protein
VLERILDREQILRELLDRVLVRLRDVGLALAEYVLDLGARAKPRVLHLGGLALGTGERVVAHALGGARRRILVVREVLVRFLGSHVFFG